MRTGISALLLSLTALSFCARDGFAQGNCPAPRPMRFEVTGEVRRSELAFTEGLEFHDGALYESSGDLFGTSRVVRIDPASGKVTVLYDGQHQYFGEGLTIFGGHIYQMTWREHRVFLRDLNGRALREFRNPREGWGLTHDAGRLIASDGSDRLFFIRPSDFATLGSVTVREGGRSIDQINELEYADGAVFANVFQTWRVLKIDPRSGCVLAAADLSGLHARFTQADRDIIDAEGNFVLNGIAHDPKTGLFTVTGKDWPVLFTGRFVEN
jgi:glutamine cyclotransferase